MQELTKGKIYWREVTLCGWVAVWQRLISGFICRPMNSTYIYIALPLGCKKSTIRGTSFSLLLPSQGIFLFVCVCLFRAAPAAYGGSQARGWIRATAAGLHYSHNTTRSELHLWPTPHLMATPDHLTQWVRPGIKPVSLWILVRFVFTEPRWKLQGIFHSLLQLNSLLKRKD